ncbi:TIGR00282 family metallophosphoesterase [Patescibacteria group bacterium]
MNVLFFGDIVGRPGRQALKKILPEWKNKYQPDLIIANGENSSHGKGITKKCLDEILSIGVDLITLGDHSFDQKETISLLENKKNHIIRPANYPSDTPGSGYYILEIGSKKVIIINLIGQTYMSEQYDNPFTKANEILEQIKDEANIIIVDFHAEATSEKVCMGWHLDGRVSAVLGTHTHIPTADARILTNGTAYISDVGMVGSKDSSLGMDKDIAIKRFLTQIKTKFEIAQGPVIVNAVLLENNKNGKTKEIKQLQKTIAL